MEGGRGVAGGGRGVALTIDIFFNPLYSTICRVGGGGVEFKIIYACSGRLEIGPT